MSNRDIDPHCLMVTFLFNNALPETGADKEKVLIIVDVLKSHQLPILIITREMYPCCYLSLILCFVDLIRHYLPF